MSFSLNFNEIIGSIDEKLEVVKMKQEMQQKDDCIQELLKRIEQLEKKVDTHTSEKINTSNENQSDSTEIPSQINIVNQAKTAKG